MKPHLGQFPYYALLNSIALNGLKGGEMGGELFECAAKIAKLEIGKKPPSGNETA